MLGLDTEFLATSQPSGSTGTFVFVQPGADGDEQFSLRVGNIGDSRVLLGRPDGTMIEGVGTDGGLTIDHKPDSASERERIYRTGGTVENVMGVARVNGDLAVSRAFGDSQYKITGGPKQEDHPVSAAPEHFKMKCGKTDFLVLVCDGISEGSFPNKEVIALIAEELRKDGEKPDLAKAAVATCRQALKAGSMDNLSCMIVTFAGDAVSSPALELLPGPFESPSHAGFRKAYEAMAAHAGLSLAQAVELRHDAAKKERAAPAQA